MIEFIQQAAKDPRVVAIKQTVYRTGTDSVIMQTLIDAARAGKEVTVVVELMARFDEEANINWAARLEEVGAHVVYGVVGHKTHAKMALVVRREDGKLVRYAHLGTGNYHPRTARLYTDVDLLTADEGLTNDVNEVFQQLTGLGKVSKLKHMWQAPFTLHQSVLDAIENETRIARSGRPARIVAKMNALLEPQVIEALYKASQAGREDRPRGARRLRAAPGRAGAVREHPRALDHRPLPRAHAHLRVQGRRPDARVPFERRLDGPQLLPPHRALLPDHQREAAAPRRERGDHALSRGQHPGVGHAARRDLQARQARPPEGAMRAGRSCSRRSRSSAYQYVQGLYQVFVWFLPSWPKRVGRIVLREHLLRVVAKLRHPHAVVRLDHDRRALRLRVGELGKRAIVSCARLAAAR